MVRFRMRSHRTHGMMVCLGILFAVFWRVDADCGERVPLTLLTQTMGIRPDGYTLEDVCKGGSFWADVQNTKPLAKLGFSGLKKGHRVWVTRLAPDRWLVYAPEIAERIRIRTRRHVNPLIKPRILLRAEYHESMRRSIQTH